MAIEQKKIGTLGSNNGQVFQEIDESATPDNIRIFEGGSGAKFLDISSQTYKTTIDRMRNSPVPLNPNIIYKTTDAGMPREWEVDEADTTSVDNGGTILVNSFGQRIKLRFSGRVNIKWFGAVGDGVVNDTIAIDAAKVALNAVDYRGVLYFPEGVYLYTGSLSLSGCGFVIQGDGAKFNHQQSKPVGSVIKAVNQTGPVIDLTGYRGAGAFRGNNVFRDFTIQGDGNSGIEKSGIYVYNVHALCMQDMLFIDTGGPGLDLHRSYVSNFERLTFVDPIDAFLNDVPYLRLRGSNGHRFYGCGFRSMSSPGATGASGVVTIGPDGSDSSHSNSFDSLWFEFTNPADNGTLINIAGQGNIFNDTQFFDITKNSGATNTSYFRLSIPATGTNFGGNIIRGEIPGRDNSLTGSVDYGVDCYQSRNKIEGVRGYQGNNVRLNPGCGLTTVTLGGSKSNSIGTASPMVEDNSGLANNVFIDYFLGEQTIHSYKTAPLADGVELTLKDGSPAKLYVGEVVTSQDAIEIIGSIVDLSLGELYFKNISTNTSLSRSGTIENRTYTIWVSNTSEAPVTFAINNVNFPDGAVNTIPPLGYGWATFIQVNGVMKGKIEVYS